MYRFTTKCFQILLEVFTFAKMKSKKKEVPENKRSNHVNFSLNDKEYALLCTYIKKYKIENRSRWCRETLVTHILKTLDMDYPTLFDENEMRR